MRKPKIAIVTWFHCLRNIKLAVAAYNLGYELECITKRQGFGLLDEMQYTHIYNNIRLWESPSQLEAALKKSDADIIWCHNEPDIMTEVAVFPEVKKKRLVIHDCHDLPTLHPGHEKDLAKQENEAITKSDYVFVPTPDYVELIHRKYGMKDKVKVVYSCSPKEFFPDTDFPRVNGMVYCGQVNVPEMNSKLRYRDCLPLFKFLTQIGLATHIYSTSPDANLEPYKIAGSLVHGTLRMFAAMHQYTRYDYGFVGSNVDCQEIQICMPNKLFDCMASGIPLICLNAKTAGEFITRNEIGLAVQGLQNMAQVPWGDWEMWERFRKNVRELRYEYTAEKTLKKAFDAIGI